MEQTGQTPPKFIKVQTASKTSVENLTNELLNSDLLSKLKNSTSADPNALYEILEYTLVAAKAKHMPSKDIKYNKYKHKKNKWMTHGILRSIKFRDKLYKRMRTTDISSSEHIDAKRNLATYNRILRKLINDAKTLYYHSCFDKYMNNIKKTWSTINEILNKIKKKKQFPKQFIENGQPIEDKLEIANRFNIYFTNIGPSLAHGIEADPEHHFKMYLKTKYKHKFSFSLVDEDATRKIIQNLQPKSSCGYDGISTKLLKLLCIVLVAPLTIIINQSLKMGIFPDKLKIARVIPLYKKDDETLFNNYRPISLLPAISKVFEKTIFNQLYDYFQKYKLFYKSQYGFRSGHSTELATLELLDRILQEMDNGKIPMCIFLDLSKAFDTLNHEILIEKLSYYGVKDKEAKLFKSYLTGRKQYVDYDGMMSESLLIETGVPQGSILGPLLFIIYINDIANVSELFHPIIYADDTSLTSTLNTFGSKTTEDFDDIINTELSKVIKWLNTNKLSLNIQKTKFMIFHQPQKVFRQPKIVVNDISIESVNSFNFLGIHLDKHLNWKQHLSTISSKISRAVGIITKLKHQLPTDIKLKMYNSLILCYINYGILAWGHKFTKLEKLQKRAIRVVAGTTCIAHTSPLFKCLKLLKIRDIFTLAKLKFYYKFCNDELPLYLQQLPIKKCNESHNYNTRRAAQGKLYLPKIYHEFAKNNLRYSILATVNDLPKSVTDKVSTHSLKGVTNYFKSNCITEYTVSCEYGQNCYVCNFKPNVASL
jgi:hypothetical protein